MSSSRQGDFERWLRERFAETGGLTALILLVTIGDKGVRMLSCAHLQFIGDEATWQELRGPVDQSGHRWDGVGLFAETAPGGGPLIEVVAKARLQERIDDVMANRMVPNDPGFFDPKGRAIRIDPVQ